MTRQGECRDVAEVTRREMPQQPTMREREERATRAEPEQREADDHVRKMVPVDHREEID